MPVDIQIIESPEVEKELISLRAKPKVKQEKIVLEKVELSDRIQKFDKLAKRKVYTENPYSHQAVRKQIQTKTSSNAVLDPTYNTVGKYLGVDTRRDWDQVYEKVMTITDWAKRKSGETDLSKILLWLGRKTKSIPSVSGNTLGDLYLFSKLEK